MNSPRPSITIALLLTLSAWPAARALAYSAEASRPVRYTESDLSHRDGAIALYGRLRLAADQVCRSLDGATLDRKHQFAVCRAAALDEAVRAIGSPRVTALHEGRGSTPVWASR